MTEVATVTNKDKRGFIADELQTWLDYIKTDKITDYSMVTPAIWPNRGTVKAWIKILRSDEE